MFSDDTDVTGSVEAVEIGGGTSETLPARLREKTADGFSVTDVKNAFGEAESRVMREMILAEGLRLDGRRTDEVRPIWSEVDYLPRVHGSALFTRGETQTLVQVTLGTGRDVQAIDQLFDQVDKPGDRRTTRGGVLERVLQRIALHEVEQVRTRLPELGDVAMTK